LQVRIFTGLGRAGKHSPKSCPSKINSLFAMLGSFRRVPCVSEFKDIKALVVDPAGHSKALLRKLLTAFGVGRIMTTHATDEALVMLRREPFSIVFLDETAGPLKPLSFLRMLRRDHNTSDVTVPVVLVSAATDVGKITAARDSGMNDVISKPVSGETIERKLRSLLEAPKPFVTTKAFVGPDRRTPRDERRQFGERPPKNDRRGKKRASVPVIRTRLNSDETF
jgi:two-component system chemotaxis response regulator CheY